MSNLCGKDARFSDHFHYLQLERNHNQCKQALNRTYRITAKTQKRTMTRTISPQDKTQSISRTTVYSRVNGMANPMMWN